MSGSIRARAALPAAFVLGLVAVGAWLAHRDWAGVTSAMHELGATQMLAAFLLAAAGMGAMMMSWIHAVRAVGVPLTWQQGRAIFPVAQLTKYVPGGVWPVLAQAALARQVGAPTATVAVAGSAHLLLSVGTALVVGASLAVVATDVPHELVVLALVGGLAALAALSPPALERVLRMVQRRPPDGADAPVRLSASDLARSVAWCVCANLLFGAQVEALMPGGFDLPDIGTAIAAYCLASAAGVLIVLAPAGAGAREGVMALVLAPAIGTGAALLVAVASRIIMMGVDVALAATQTGAVSAVARARASAPPHRRR